MHAEPIHRQDDGEIVAVKNNWQLENLWLQQKINDATYLRCLFFSGYDAVAANQQLALLRKVKQETENEKVTRCK